MQKAGDGQTFCKGCYAERYLPKCRKCRKAIEGGAVTSSDGKVLGKVSALFFLSDRELELTTSRIVVAVSSSMFLVLLMLEEFPIWRFLRFVSHRDKRLSLLQCTAMTDASSPIPTAMGNPIVNTIIISSTVRSVRIKPVLSNLSKDPVFHSSEKRMEVVVDVSLSPKPLIQLELD